MKATEIRERSDEELRALAAQLGEELLKHRLARHTQQLENTMKIRQTRRDLARIHTTVRARELAGRAAKPAKE